MEYKMKPAYKGYKAYEYLEDYQQAEVLMNAYLQNYPDDQTAIREQQFLSTR